MLFILMSHNESKITDLIPILTDAGRPRFHANCNNCATLIWRNNENESNCVALNIDKAFARKFEVCTVLSWKCGWPHIHDLVHDVAWYTLLSNITLNIFNDFVSIFFEHELQMCIKLSDLTLLMRITDACVSSIFLLNCLR